MGARFGGLVGLSGLLTNADSWASEAMAMPSSSVVMPIAASRLRARDRVSGDMPRCAASWRFDPGSARRAAALGLAGVVEKILRQPRIGVARLDMFELVEEQAPMHGQGAGDGFGNGRVAMHDLAKLGSGNQ